MTEAMGHGVNQRRTIEMTPAEIDAFLAERRAMSMCSIAPDGSIHAVAMWYGFLDGCVTVETKAKSQKVQNLRRDPRLTLLFEAGDYYEELRGVELVGQAEIVEDPDKLWTLGVSVFERYYAPYSEELKPFIETMLHKRVAIKLNVDTHRELGSPQARPALDPTGRVRFTFDQHVGVAPEVAMCAYGEPSFYETRDSLEQISVVEVLDHQDNDTSILIEVRFKFTGSVSPAVKSVIDPDKLSWVTHTEVLLEERRTRFTVVPDYYPDRLTSSGEYRFGDGSGPNAAVVTVDGDLVVHVPIVGRSVEKAIVSGLRSYIATEVESLPDFTPPISSSWAIPSSMPVVNTSMSSVVS